MAETTPTTTTTQDTAPISPATATTGARVWTDADHEASARKVSSFGHGTLHSSETMSTWQLIRMGFGTVRRLASALGGWVSFIKVFNKSRALRNDREADAIHQLQQLGVSHVEDCKTLLMMPFMFAAATAVLGSEERAHQAFQAAVLGVSAADVGLDLTEVARSLPAGADAEFAMRVYSKIMKSVNAIDARDGVRHVVDIEDTPTTAGFDVTFCAYAEAFRIVGFPAACGIVCSGDELFIPPAIEPLGLHFDRTGTIGKGQQRCDFRFKVGPKPTPAPEAPAPAPAPAEAIAPTAVIEVAQSTSSQ